MPVLWLALFLLTFTFHRALAALVNVTIDDTNGDPLTGAQFVYTPPTSWNIGQACVGCTAHPDPELLYDQTWHDGTFNPVAGSNNNPNQPIFATIDFNGSAVYVYCVLADTFTSPDGNTDMTFYIDNDVVGAFALAPTGSQTYQYNVSVYSNTSIPAGPHTLTIQTGHVNGLKSLMLIDTVVYSTDIDDSDAPQSPTTPSLLPPISVPGSTPRPTSSILPIGSPSEPSSPVPTSYFASLTASVSPSSTATAVAASLSPTSKKSHAMIMGVVFSLIFLSAIVVVAFFLWRRRRKVQAQELALASTPLDPPTGTLGDRMVARQGFPPLSAPQPNRYHDPSSGSFPSPTYGTEDSPPYEYNVAMGSISPTSDAPPAYADNFRPYTQGKRR